MRSVRKPVFLCLLLATMTLVGVFSLPKRAEAWGFCHEGTTRWSDLHCSLGIAADCSECWITP